MTALQTLVGLQLFCAVRCSLAHGWKLSERWRCRLSEAGIMVSYPLLAEGCAGHSYGQSGAAGFCFITACDGALACWEPRLDDCVAGA